VSLKAAENANHPARVLGLDIFRSCAILLVMFFHAGFLLSNTSLKGFPRLQAAMGFYGVDMFFILSGFLIGGILLKEIETKKEFGMPELFQFWKRRWFRILPNYYLILLVNYFIAHYKLLNVDVHLYSWKFLFFLQNFSTPFYGFFGESWSLTIEEWFYISFPLFLAIFLDFMSPKKAFLLVIILMILYSTRHRILSVNYTIDDWGWSIIFLKVVLMRLDSIAYGLLAAWLFYYYGNYWSKLKIPGLIVGIGLLSFLLFYKIPNNTFYKEVTYLTLSPISAMLMLPFIRSIHITGVAGKAITHISKISYSLYLINGIVDAAIMDNFPVKNSTDGIIKYLLFWTISIVCSTLLYKYFERPIMNLRDSKLLQTY
jgi:peptidoglycan/LPS O-acetylase OafA/YrhL